MTNPVEALIALGDRPLGSAEEALIEDLDREIVELDMLVARSGKPAEGDLALLLEEYEAFTDTPRPAGNAAARDHDFIAMLARLPADLRESVADLAADKPLRRALITGDDPTVYLAAQHADGWVRLRYQGLPSTITVPPAALADPARLARLISHAYHGGANPDDDAPYYLRVIETDHEEMPPHLYLVIDRASDAVVDSPASRDSAERQIAMLNRNPLTAPAYVQAAILGRRLRDRGQHLTADTVAAVTATLAHILRVHDAAQSVRTDSAA